ncbi:tyrosine-type recombinase/integrase [Candidatus Methylospira mobilis]|uniref:tyrosine-type recombinase/integrase n=1 Tax=Candidatus Methylospira mobilis TaxID=1808979 RepID=UPI0018856A19|nr:tyrosine-type recombinase/integrase [Candidatus Methylospira mobilis]
MNKGIDPALKKANDIQRNRQEQLAEKLKLDQQAARATINDLFDRWVSLELSQRKESSRDELVRAFNKDVLPVIGKMPADDVTKAHVMNILDNILSRGARRLANRTLSELRQMFGFGYTRDIIKTDPTHRLSKADIGGKETQRDRVLSEAEIRLLTIKIPEAGLHPATECAIWIMLATGCRIGDLMKATWDEIDQEARTWVFSPEKDQTHIKRTHTVYLSDFAWRQFERLRDYNGGGQWLYPNREVTAPVCKKSVTKQIGDRQRTKAPLSGRSRLVDSLVLPGGNWTPHDLRRTCVTVMVELGVSGDVAHLCTYHIEQDVIKRTYNRAKQVEAQKQAWKLLGDRLEILTSGNIDNVVLLRQAS